MLRPCINCCRAAILSITHWRCCTSVGYVVAMQHTFGSAVEKHRKRLGLTFRAFSEAILEVTGETIDSSGLNRIESGQREPRLSEALAIARTLGVPLEALTGVVGGNVWFVAERMKTDLARLIAEIQNFGEAYADLGDIIERATPEDREQLERITKYDDLGDFDAAILDAAATGEKLLHFLRFPSKYFPDMK